jgi:hypothetical protein
MSTLQKINFTPVSDILPVQRRDFSLADPTLAQPLNAIALVDGEWMTLTSAYQIVRATDIGTVGAVGLPGTTTVPIPRSFPLFAERGRYDVQALSASKMPILWRGDYEFDTRIFSATAAVGTAGGAAITYVMQPLKVATIAFSGRNFTGLVGHGTLGSGDTDPIVGYVTRLPANNGGQLRFISGWRS